MNYIILGYSGTGKSHRIECLMNKTSRKAIYCLALRFQENFFTKTFPKCSVYKYEDSNYEMNFEEWLNKSVKDKHVVLAPKYTESKKWIPYHFTDKECDILKKSMRMKNKNIWIFEDELTSPQFVTELLGTKQNNDYVLVFQNMDTVIELFHVYNEKLTDRDVLKKIKKNCKIVPVCDPYCNMIPKKEEIIKTIFNLNTFKYNFLKNNIISFDKFSKKVFNVKI